MLRRFLGATREHGLSHVTEEQRRNRPTAGLPEGPGRFWPLASLRLAYIAAAMRARRRLGACPSNPFH